MKNQIGNVLNYHGHEHRIIDWYEESGKTYYIAEDEKGLLRVWTTRVLDRGKKVKGKDFVVNTIQIPCAQNGAVELRVGDIVHHVEDNGIILRLIHSDISGESKDYYIAKLNNGRRVIEKC